MPKFSKGCARFPSFPHKIITVCILTEISRKINCRVKVHFVRILQEGKSDIAKQGKMYYNKPMNAYGGKTWYTLKCRKNS